MGKNKTIRNETYDIYISSGLRENCISWNSNVKIRPYLLLTQKQSVNVKYYASYFLFIISQIVYYCQFFKIFFPHFIHHCFLSPFLMTPFIFSHLENALLQNVIVITCPTNIFITQINDCARLNNKNSFYFPVFMIFLLTNNLSCQLNLSI